jgi:hypothetical protein
LDRIRITNLLFRRLYHVQTRRLCRTILDKYEKFNECDSLGILPSLCAVGDLNVDLAVVWISLWCLTAIRAYHHKSSWQVVLDTTLCDKVCQWLVTGRWFSAGTLVTSTNKTDRHDIAGILLKVELNTITTII